MLDVQDLRLAFHTALGDVQVLRGVNLAIGRGTIIGLVGESGCGKSMTARSVVGLMPANAELSGRVEFGGRDLLGLPPQEMRTIRGSEIAPIFQDPSAALNPLLTIGVQLTRILHRHDVGSARETRARALELLREVGLGDPGRLLGRYPHQLSGGMQQRVMIAMALAGSPELLIADEPTTALDVTIQAQILQLLRNLTQTRGISVLLITHDMAVVAQSCETVAVLYAGVVVERGPVQDVLAHPRHPYTEALLAAVPVRANPGEKLRVIGGAVPDGRIALPPCVFADRCPYVMEICRTEPPPTFDIGSQQAACWLHDDAHAGAHPEAGVRAGSSEAPTVRGVH
jgi:oligopeptide/dipeptide ABC transporter ATP-binding protein